MRQEDSSELKEEVQDILLPNGSFYRESPDDKNLYLIDIAAVGALAYQIIQFAANVFGVTVPMIAGARWLYKKYFPNETIPAVEATKSPVDSINQSIPQSELNNKLERLRSNAKDPVILGQLIEDITKILEYHGWPASEANFDAKRIVTTLMDDRNA